MMDAPLNISCIQKSSPNSVGNLRSVNTTRFGTTLTSSISNYLKKTTYLKKIYLNESRGRNGQPSP